MVCQWPFIEIERKFLVRSNDWKANICRTTTIRQSYFPGTIGMTVRVRQTDHQSRITWKTGRIGISRAEFEIGIGPGYAEWLFGLCPYPAIKKHRCHVLDQCCTWHVDTFLGRHAGLTVAEIELEHPTQSFCLPDWIGDEVTHDRRISNSSLYFAASLPNCTSDGRLVPDEMVKRGRTPYGAGAKADGGPPPTTPR
ncbi:MAG: CYTH domain-containing protein [Magnetospirillum sp.]|nr:MAG: CYTH domain-containing protein [Magnetospirillum sp.]